jgi:hypothetical protein
MYVVPSVYACSVLSRRPAAAETNKQLDFAGLRVYGLLTDLTLFRFFSYDPSTTRFCFDETLLVNVRRTDAHSDMIDRTYFSQWQLPES